MRGRYSRKANTHAYIAAVLGIAVSALIFLTGCAEEGPIRIGFAGQISGLKASSSANVRNGTVLAVEEANEAGGVHGRTIELIIRDDEGDREKALEVAKKLHEAEVEAIIGHTTSSTSAASIDYINKVELPMLSPTATAGELKGRDDYFFTFLSGNAQLSEKSAQYARNELRIERISTIIDLSNEAYTEDFTSSFLEVFLALGGRLASEHSFFTDTETRFETLVQDAVGDDPDGLLVVAASLDTAMIIQQLYKMKKPLPVISCDWAMYNELLNQGGPYVEHAYFANVFSSSNRSEAFRKFEKRFETRFSETPTNGAALGYETAKVLIEALRRKETGEEKEEGLREILLSGTFEGLEEKLEFNKYGDLERTIYMKTVENGHFEDVAGGR